MKHGMKLALSCCTALLLASCTVGPDYSKPEVTAPEKFVSQSIINELNEGKPAESFDTNWWTGFNDPLLNKLVDESLSSNYDIIAAAARVTQAKEAVSIADSGDALTSGTDLDGNVDKEIEVDGGDLSTSKRLFATFGAVLPLDVFGKTQRSVESAKAQYESSKEELRGIVLGISADVASEYLRLRGNQLQLELLRESVALQEKTLSIVRTRFESGLSPELDLQRAITTVENLRSRIPTLEESLQNSRNRLASLTGNFPGVYEGILSKKRTLPFYTKRIPESFPMDVLKSRPDVLQAEAELKASFANIGVAEADFYPSFEISGDISIGTSGVSGAPTTEVLIASLGGLIEQFVTDGGVRNANLAIAKAAAEESLAQYKQTLQAAVEDVEISLAALHASKLRQESLQKAVTSSERSFAQAEILYQQGLISFLDVVDAQRVLADARQALAAENTGYATEIANLFEAFGTEVKESKNI